jgi:DHA1 family tetracycline resistance protein-like MFS transporter
MNNLFAYATNKNSLFYLPGASFYLGAFLMIIAAFLAYRTLSTNKK